MGKHGDALRRMNQHRSKRTVATMHGSQVLPAGYSTSTPRKVRAYVHAQYLGIAWELLEALDKVDELEAKVEILEGFGDG